MVDFLIIGGTKCGSTSLADYVSVSKMVNFCTEKEPAILNKRNLTVEQITFYHRLFLDKPGLRGEATPAYSDWNQVGKVIDNLKKINAKPKIILSVRNQIKRIESSHVQKIKSRKLKSSSKMSISLEPPGILNRGRFGAVIEKYIVEFGKENVLVLNFDLLTEEDSPELKRLKHFLNLEDHLSNTLPKSNSSVGAAKKHWLFILYKKYLYSFWKTYNLPSFRRLIPFIAKTSNKVTPKEQLRLTDDQIDFLKNFYKEDDQLFQSITGWSYWSLKK